jgi:DNA-binding NarL/FixJ family response regulator
MTTAPPSPTPPASDRIDLLLVDDSPEISIAVARAAAAQPGIRVVGAISSAEQLLEAVRRLRPRVVLLDLSMDGVDPLSVVGKLGESTRVVVFSGHDDTATRQRAFMAGAWGFVSKAAEPSEMFEAIRAVDRGSLHGLVD